MQNSIPEFEVEKKITPVDLNKVYLYGTKPKIIIWMKKIIGGMVLLAFFLFMINNILGYFFTNNEFSNLKDNFYGKNIIFSFYYLYPFVSIFAIYYAFRKEVYDRQKYSFSLFYSILMILYIAFWLAFIWKKQDNLNKQEANLDFIKVWKVINIINIAIFLFLIFIFIFLNLIKPKIDQTKVQKLQTELYKKRKAELENENYEMDLNDIQ